MRLKRGIVYATSLLALFAASCLPGLREPEVRLAGVRLGGLGLQGGVLYAQLHVTNPNRFGITASGVTYDLEVLDSSGDGEQWYDFAEGAYATEFTVGARDSATVEVPIQFRYEAVGGAIRSIVARGLFEYRVSGAVSIEEPVRTTVPFRRRGVVSFDGGS